MCTFPLPKDVRPGRGTFPSRETCRETRRETRDARGDARGGDAPAPKTGSVCGMFEFVVGVGLRLPEGAGTLRPGMPERSAQWAVATLADVRETWVCGAGWTFTARYAGLTLTAVGDTRDRYGHQEDRPGLADIGLTRDPYTLAGPSDCPVVLNGVDLFGHPADEVLDALGGRPPGQVRLRPAADGGYLAEVRMSA